MDTGDSHFPFQAGILAVQGAGQIDRRHMGFHSLILAYSRIHPGIFSK